MPQTGISGATVRSSGSRAKYGLLILPTVLQSDDLPSLTCSLPVRRGLQPDQLVQSQYGDLSTRLAESLLAGFSLNSLLIIYPASRQSWSNGVQNFLVRSCPSLGLSVGQSTGGDKWEKLEA